MADVSPASSNPGYAALRRHRCSLPGAEYFVTATARRPTDGFAHDAIIGALTSRRLELDRSGTWNVRCWVVMPDHLHILFTLGETEPLPGCIRAFKGPLTPHLRAHGLRWQDGYFEHRLRADEDRLPVFLYIFLNPYRAGLVDHHEAWPGYYCAPDDWAWFEPLTNSGTPFPEWLCADESGHKAPPT